MKSLKLIVFAVLAAQFSFAQTAGTLYIRSRAASATGDYPANATFDYLDNSPGSVSNPHAQSLVIADWTSSGIPYVWRSFLKFDLSSLPAAGLVIDSAYLSLYADTTSASGLVGNPTWGTANAVGIYRLTGAWDTTIVWGTQPGYTPLDSAVLTQSTNSKQNYPHTNVTAMVKDMVTSGNYGFLFRHLQETTTLNSMIFKSPNTFSTDSTQTPLLVVHYRTTAAVTNVGGNTEGFDVYPNPAASFAAIRVSDPNAGSSVITISDCIGRIYAVKNIDKCSTGNEQIDVAHFAPGVYLVSLSTQDGRKYTKRLVIQ
jgi:hypothetical protein